MRVPALPRSLAAEETSPKETGLFFLHPSLSFCCLWAAEWVCIDQRDKGAFQAPALATASELWAFVNALSPPFLSGQLHAR